MLASALVLTGCSRDDQATKKKPEAATQLMKLANHAKRVAAETGAFPKGTAPPTPAAPCCRGPNKHCPASPSLYAQSEVWKALDFHIDEPTLFQYEYAGSPDGTRFVARAVGDLDCDGVEIEYVLHGELNSTGPRITYVEPPPNSD